MMVSSNDKTLSFADLIQQYNVEVPIIQRDYAQGRATPKAKTIREKFVKDLLNCLTNSLDNGVGLETLELAFVYGHIHNGVFVPVDGQQRLTTLFLLHLYLVKRCMKESSCQVCKYADVLSRFTYATRQSAREFCGEVVSCHRQIVSSCTYQESDGDKESGSDLKDFICEQPWFFVEWGNDPTIVGMLEVLQVIHLQINEKCKGKTDKKKFLYDLLALLYSDKCPIRFHFLDMGQSGLSDDIYLKMNARGLPLDDFECFKSDFEDFLKSAAWANSPNLSIAGTQDNDCSEWDKMADYKRITWKFDKTWGDRFWSRYKSESQTMLMRVIARYFDAVAHIYATDESKKEYSKFSAIADGDAEYVSFKPFSMLLETDNGKNIVNQLSRFLDNITKLENFSFPSWIEAKAKNDILNPLNIKERVVFSVFALLNFDVANQKTGFNECMRVVWNVVENSNVEEKNFASYIRLFHGWMDKSADNNILRYLASFRYNDELAKEQIKQECVKAKLLTDGYMSSEWRDFISKEEDKAFFHGDISVQIEDGITLDEAKKRQEWLAAYIKVDTRQQEQTPEALKFVKALISQLKSWEYLYCLFGHENGGFSLTDDNYHRWARSEIGRKAIINALCSPEKLVERGKDIEQWKLRLFSLLVKSDILNNAKSGLPYDARIHFTQGHCYLHKSYDRNYYYLLDTPLYDVLDKLASSPECKITINPMQRKNGFFHFDPIYITYRGKIISAGATNLWIDNSERVKWFDAAKQKSVDECVGDMVEALNKVINSVT